MQTLETTDPKEAWRCRIAQYSGTSRRLTVGAKSVTGIVRSIREVRSGTRPTWIITILRHNVTAPEDSSPTVNSVNSDEASLSGFNLCR